MSRRRILISFSLIALALLSVIAGVFFVPSSHDLVVPIDRSGLDLAQVKQQASMPVPVTKADTVRSLALTSSPDPRLIEKSALGLLPRKAQNGDRPAEIYARQYDASRIHANLPKLSIAIMHSGISETMTAEIYLSLPPDVSFSVSPYAHDAERQIRDISNRGHDVFLEVQSKTDAKSSEDRGPYAIDPTKSAEINRDHLYWMMSRFTGYVGIVGDVTSGFAQAKESYDMMIGEAKTRGLYYLEYRRADSDSRVNENQADTASAPQRTPVILPGTHPDELRSVLDVLETRLRQDGQVIAFIDPGPLALDVLKEWIVKHQSHEFDLMPLSALMRLQEKV